MSEASMVDFPDPVGPVTRSNPDPFRKRSVSTFGSQSSVGVGIFEATSRKANEGPRDSK